MPIENALFCLILPQISHFLPFKNVSDNPILCRSNGIFRRRTNLCDTCVRFKTTSQMANNETVLEVSSLVGVYDWRPWGMG